MQIPALLSYTAWNTGPVFDEYLHFKTEVADLFQLPEFNYDTSQFLAPLLFYLDSEKTVHISNEIAIDPANSEYWTTEDESRSAMDTSWKILECDIRRYGGIIMNSVTPNTSFIITLGSRVNVFNNIQKAAGFLTKRLSVISRSWIEDCIKSKTILNEDNYKF
jgi:BRCT domain, a BRCA1 C-terminus domain